jgi:hypothetical protein
MNIRNALVFLVALTINAPATAMQYRYGAGIESCGTWLDDRANRNHWVMTQWMLGYISAVGSYSVYRLRRSESQAFVAYMDKYCRQNPLEDFEFGVRRLIQDLRVD